MYQDTWSCVVWLSSGVRDTVCYLYEQTFSRIQLFIAQKLLADFNQNHVLDAL